LTCLLFTAPSHLGLASPGAPPALGVFTRCAIRNGQVLGPYAGRVLTTEALMSARAHMETTAIMAQARFIRRVDADLYVDASDVAEANIFREVQDPRNERAVNLVFLRGIAMVTRDIAPGEELYTDLGAIYWRKVDAARTAVGAGTNKSKKKKKKTVKWAKAVTGGRQ
jgi:hypothetical protein